MKASELRQKDVAGVTDEIKALQKAHFGLRMQKGTQQLNNTATLRNIANDIVTHNWITTASKLIHKVANPLQHDAILILFRLLAWFLN